MLLLVPLKPNHIFFFGARLLSKEINYFIKFSIWSFTFQTFKRELLKISVNQLFRLRFLESSFQHYMDHMMMIIKTSFQDIKVFIKILNNTFKQPLQLKVVSTTFLLICFFCLKESTCETRKNVFYFTSKALFVLEIIKFKLSRYSNVITSSYVGH